MSPDELAAVDDVGEILPEAAELVVEPGRAVVTTAGTVHAEVAGPPRAGDAVPYKRTRVLLQTTLRAGGRVRFSDTGAYTASYSSVSFNGFSPLTIHVLGAEGE